MVCIHYTGPWQVNDDQTGGRFLSKSEEHFIHLHVLSFPLRKVDALTVDVDISNVPKSVPTLTKDQMGLLRRYIPKAVWDRLLHGQTEFIEEIRMTSVIFMNVQGIHLGCF